MTWVSPWATSAFGDRCHQHKGSHLSHRAYLQCAVARLSGSAVRSVRLFPIPCRSNLLDSEAYTGYIKPDRYHPKVHDPPSSHQRRLNHNLLILRKCFQIKFCANQPFGPIGVEGEHFCITPFNRLLLILSNMSRNE